jgi:hypothetical protein
MPKVQTVKAARKSPGVCLGCKQPILAGEAYRWVKLFGPRGRIFRHVSCGYFRDSELAKSPLMARLHLIRENAFDELHARDIPTPADVKAILAAAAASAREEAARMRESVRRLEEGCRGGRTSIADRLEDRAEAIEVWAEALEVATDGVDTRISNPSWVFRVTEVLWDFEP